MSSTRRTEMPARHISIRASSTELSRRRYRSMIALSKVWRRSFGTLRLTSPALVCSVRWKLQKEWKSNLDTPGVIQLSYMKNLFRFDL